jgi:hypothetical protein
MKPFTRHEFSFTPDQSKDGNQRTEKDTAELAGSFPGIMEICWRDAKRQVICWLRRSYGVRSAVKPKNGKHEPTQYSETMSEKS